ncbi:MAG: response regulator [Microcoleus vaginatus WJT46-NPBG5]|jgi:type IV pili sensor histidine kinase/response regulator|nr:response regulator [Microcoleus vaginatus WJT46-NPBG5]
MKPEKKSLNSQFSPLNSPLVAPEKLDSITQDIRANFLEEVPELLAILKQKILQIQQDPENLQAESAALIRAAHSLKEAAGIAQFSTVSLLAHKMEDLLLEIQQGNCSEPAFTCDLLWRTLQAIQKYLAGDNSSQGLSFLKFPTEKSSNFIKVNIKNSKINRQLENIFSPTPTPIDNLLGRQVGKETENFSLTNQEKNIDLTAIGTPSRLDFAKNALLVDLEESLQKVEQWLNLKPNFQETNECISEKIKESLTILVEECILLGKVLNLIWLKDMAELLEQAIKDQKIPLKQLGMTVVAHIRQMRGEFLGEVPIQSDRKEEIPQPSTSTSPPEIPEQFLKYLIGNESNLTGIPSLNLQMPVARLDRMSNTVGELFINYEQLTVYQQQLDQASRKLKKHFQKLIPISERMGNFSEQHSRNRMKQEELNLEDEEINLTSQSSAFNFPTPSQMQGFQELLVQVRETRADVDLIAHELQETLEQLHTSIERLHEDLTESRLVPFELLAERFKASLQMLRQQDRKSVELVIEGKETLINQAVLQQLHAPLIQLFRHAFVNGIELPAERKAQGKLPMAKITLSAAIRGSHVVISLADDGQGIDPQKVYRRAVEMGLISSLDSEFGAQEPALTSAEMLEFLFAPGFSTAATLSDLSEGGVNLDLVRHQVGHLRGSVQVETAVSQGTKFTITIPLTLSILTLLLCRCGQQTLAIPSIDVLEVISLSGSSSSTKPSFNPLRSPVLEADERGMIDWHDRSVPLFSLIELLPYRRVDWMPAAPTLPSSLGIVLDVCGEPVVVAVDALLGERELVLKPFDSTVPVPIYIAGCTVLGTGEVVPVLSPNQLNELINHAKQARLSDNLTGSQNFQKFKIKAQDNLLYAQTITPSVLIVDDSITVCRALDELLSKAGYQVVQCRDGKEALEQLHQLGECFDLVISDIEMPRLDGLALLAEIRAHPNTRHLPVAILTSRESDSLRQQAMSLGATAYFTKPWEPAQLLDAIAVLVTSWNSQ